MKIKSILIIFFISVIPIFSQDFPSIMYVNANNGINQYSAPQLSSEKIGAFLFGEGIFVYERGNNETIDGITDYWYKTDWRIDGTNKGGYTWVFGGYLSMKMPLGAEPILGYWDTDINAKNYWLFSPHKHFISAQKGPGFLGIYGNWILSEGILMLKIIPIETMSYSSGIIMIKITIIDSEHILFTYEDGTVESLTRSNSSDKNFF